MNNNELIKLELVRYEKTVEFGKSLNRSDEEAIVKTLAEVLAIKKRIMDLQGKTYPSDMQCCILGCNCHESVSRSNQVEQLQIGWLC